MSAKRPKPDHKREKMASTEDRDELRMKRSGAEASGYHPPTKRDIDDLRKDHRTATEAGAINADEGVRLGSTDSPLPINSLSGELEEGAGPERSSRRSA